MKTSSPHEPAEAAVNATFEVAIVGGSFAGLSAALMLARARKRVLLFDDGLPRNRFAGHSHGVLGHDGKPPRQLLDEAIAQLGVYPTVRLQQSRVRHARVGGSGFELEDEAGLRVDASRLILATGIRDLLPDVQGLAPRWGRTVLHCPYCHGYAFADRPLGVLGTGPASIHQALLIRDWGPTVYFTQGLHAPDPEQTLTLTRRGVRIEPVPVVALEGEGEALDGVRLADGRHVRLDALFTAPLSALNGELHQQLGCAIEPGLLGPLVKVDALQTTSVPGVFAAGDMAAGMQSVTLAMAAGALAGVAAHRSLLEVAAGG